MGSPELNVRPTQGLAMWSSSSLLVFFTLMLRQIEGGLKCHYCGIKDLCALPYDTLEAEFITCPKSCLKFDGYADGVRVIVRDCADSEVDECSEEPQQYANTRAMGTLCTCMGDKCNPAITVSLHSALQGALIILL